MSPRADVQAVTPWRVLSLPAASGAAAAVALTCVVVATNPKAESVPIAVTPERAAQEFSEAYQRRDWDAASRLASGALQRSLESRARSERRQRISDAAGRRHFEIEESFTLDAARLRLAGKLVSQDAPEAKVWPISITVGRHGERYLAEALTWPQGEPPNEQR